MPDASIPSGAGYSKIHDQSSNNGLRSNGNGADFNKKLRKAVRRCEFEKMEQLLQQGADPNALSKKGHSAMHIAAANFNDENVDKINILIEGGGDLHQKTGKSGKTALHFSVRGRTRSPMVVGSGYGANREMAVKLAEEYPELRRETTKNGYTAYDMMRHDPITGPELRNRLFGNVQIPAGYITHAEALEALNPNPQPPVEGDD